MRDERFIDSAIRKALGRQAPGAESSCPDENLLAAYLERSLPDQERSRLESHFSDCVSCREVLALSMKIAADEPAEVGEVWSPRERKLLFHFSAPLTAVAGLVLGIGMMIVFLLTHEGRKAERTEVAEQRAPAAAPAASNMPEPHRSSSVVQVKPAKPSAPGAARSQAAGARIGADQVARAKDKEIQAQESPAPPAYLHALESERKLSIADTAALNEAAVKPAERKGETQAGIVTAQAGGEGGAGRVVGGPVGGVVGGVLAPARPAEEPAPGEAAQQAAPAAMGSGGARDEGLNRVAKLAMKSQPATISAVSTPAAESRPRDVIRRVAADEKAGKRADSATRVIGGRTFVLSGGFWVALKCIENPDAEFIDIKPGSPELDEIRNAVPGLDELRRRGLPVLLDWNGKICVVR